MAFFGFGLRVGGGRCGVVGRVRRVTASPSEGELGGGEAVVESPSKSKSLSSPSSFWLGVGGSIEHSLREIFFTGSVKIYGGPMES